MHFLIAILLLLFCTTLPVQADEARFSGSQQCAACHKSQFEDWQKSHHAGAMQTADKQTVLGDFENAHFNKDGAETVFFKKDNRFYVHTDGPDGKPAEFEIKYTFGLYPLQQYLIELPGGRLQAFNIAWDARPMDRGGQRWFDLYPELKLAAGDPLHWTGREQNWNYQCAWCHSTNLKKNYNSQTAEFHTSWSEISVGCEACHGPASRHLTWAAGAKDLTDAEKTAKGFSRTFNRLEHGTWVPNPNGTATRSRPISEPRAEELVCAGCHARRNQFSDVPDSVAAFYDAFHPATLSPDLYYPDGQQRAEVYTFGSFAQSRMHGAGVTCSDCHNPHSGQLRATGNALCSQCHAAQVFDTPKHYNHATSSPGAQCVSCHMPSTNYMVIHARPDHSIRIPRPDRTITMGTPNACNACHADKSAQWAVDALARWGMNHHRGAQSFAEAFVAADRGAPGAGSALIALAADQQQSAIARASALEYLRAMITPDGAGTAARLTAASDPLIRASAVGALAGVPASPNVSALTALLRDPTRLVRMEAARALAGPGEASLAGDDLGAFQKAFDEYVAGQMFSAERPESRFNLGGLYLARGQADAAEKEFAAALTIAPDFAPAVIQLARIATTRGDEAGGEAILRKSLSTNASDASLHHALGLSLIRQKRLDDATAELGETTRLAPENAHFAYVYALALQKSGSMEKALAILRDTLSRQPENPEILSALISFETQSGDLAGALTHVQALRKLNPDNTQLESFERSLRERLKSPQ